MYDFIIVGAGSAGCVLANRLSSDPSIRVCLIEAGPKDSSAMVHVPLGLIGMMHSRKMNWRYYTERETQPRQQEAVLAEGEDAWGGSSGIQCHVLCAWSCM